MTRPLARCGWCITGDHRNCIVAVEMGVNRAKKINRYEGRYFWFCPCPDHGHPITRCLDCQRPDVEINQEFRCRDRADCQQYRESKPFTHPAPIIIEETDDAEVHAELKSA